MGKAGYCVVSDIFGANTSHFGSAEDQAEYVAKNLKNFNFLYKYLQETVSTILRYRMTLTSLYCRVSKCHRRCILLPLIFYFKDVT